MTQPDTQLDPDPIRERLKVLIAAGVAPRAIGNRAEPPLSETDISRFKNGAHWGLNRLARLHAALQDFEQQMLPTPTVPIEGTDHEEEAL